MITIVVTKRIRGTAPDARDRWTARTEAGDVLVESTTQPFFDGARALIANGADPDEMVTMRHAGSGHDSFKPARLGNVEGLRISEPKDGVIQIRKWAPYNTEAHDG